VLSAASLGASLSGCGEAAPERAQLLDDSAHAVFTDTSLALPKLVYQLGGETLNDRCPVRKSRLNPRMPAIYVNGRPIGFC
jgi:hypothetical protein